MTKNVTLVNCSVILNMEQSQFDVFTGTCISYLFVLRIVDFGDLARVVNRSNQALISKSESALLDFTKDRANTLVGHLVENGKTERSVRISRGKREGVNQIDKGRSVIPVANIGVDLLDEVISSQARDGNPMDVLFPEARLEEERHDVVLNFCVAILLPFNSRLVHLVDNNDELLDSETFGQVDMLAGLSFTLKSCFKLTLTGRDDQSTKVSERCTHNHIRHVVLVTRSVEYSALLGLCVEEGATHFNGFTLGLLFVRVVHHVSEPPRVTAQLLGLYLVLFNRLLINDTHLQHKVTANSGFSSINMPDEY